MDFPTTCATFLSNCTILRNSTRKMLSTSGSKTDQVMKVA